MADTQQNPSEIQINVKGPSELKLQITISTDKTVLDLKQAIADKSDVPADRQRLIYSGRVLKDEDQLTVYKIQSSHTIHMVKGVSRAPGQTSQAAPQPLPTMQTGQNPNDPLTQLNGHRAFGAMAGFNPFAQMGLNTNDPNMMQGMLQSPEFLGQMSAMMSDPAILEQILASNPQLAAMGPRVRELFQSEGFRQMMSNPETLRMMLQMSNMMGGMPGGAGAGAGAGGFPMPGMPGGAGQDGANAQGAPGSPGGSVPPPMFNPFFFPPPPTAAAQGTGAAPGATPAGGAAAGPTAGSPPTNPYGGMFDPAAMQQMLGMLGGAGGGLGGAGGLGGGLGGFGAAPAAPADSRPPEERFQVQLQQLQDMGFTNAQQNIRALLATGGNVHSAIEYILGGGGL
ncbi:ubiquitin domain-containing protein [Phanerochaete sordida]|uniref:Ubiquitin domain-containing protein n=1 Tax=Phanerochaete sordida TaxID=48140 RepID=A0A9P3G831_9APHY|nr:ubiquitin domain-containing protein [Phanerochaete sordida]